MADDVKAELTDLEYLCAFWNVDQEMAIRRCAHLTRELIDHDRAGGEVLLRTERGLNRPGGWLRRVLDPHGERSYRIRFSKPSDQNVGG